MMEEHSQRTDIKMIIRRFIKRFTKEGTLDIAATLAYYFLLSLFPFLIFLFAIIPYLGIDQSQFLDLLQRYAPTALNDVIKQNIDKVFNKNGGILSFGVIATLWPASNALNALIRALNHAYDVEETRSFIYQRLLAILFTVSMVFVIIISLGINVIGGAVFKTILHKLGFSDGLATIWHLLSLLITFVIVIIIFALLYYFCPNKKLHIKDVIIGAVVAAVSWQVVSYGFSFYIKYFGNYASTYGTLGGIIILMLWFYITALTIIVGGEINAVYRYIKYKHK
ncbi:YihY/virulence factor BrkB family protein [Terrilactibacillus tamarindi]|nr:YihY/virulence factor BrkB family protein [Terrilactibacillus tamarindi]